MTCGCLAFAEFSFAQAQVDYTMSLTRLNRATGMLLRHEQIQPVRGRDCHLPTVLFEKAEVEEVLPLLTNE